MKQASPIITTIDIELFPIEAHVWKLFDNNVGLNQIQQDWTVMSFAAKRLDPRAPTRSLLARKRATDYMDVSAKADIRDDSELVQALWHILHDSDVIIGHNMRRFDIRKIRARMLSLGMQPPSPCRVIDTLELAKSAGAFTSNKLEYLSAELTEAKKSTHKNYPGHSLWTACMAHDARAWAECKSYNIMDVLSTEELYLKLRPWATQAVNLATYIDPETVACPVCGSEHVTEDGYSFTNVSKYQRYHCQECGAWSRSRYSLNSSATRKALLSK